MNMKGANENKTSNIIMIPDQLPLVNCLKYWSV